MKKGLFLLYVVAYLFNPLIAQKQGNIWCFGANAGLNFNSGAPVGFAGIAMNQWEGCSNICDSSGNLLFYSDGNSVWNKNNVVMPNGTGLLGGNSSTQAVAIVKQPGNTNIYYVFTTDAFQGANGFKYSIVDMNLQSGLGDVTTKNTNILPVCDERVVAVHHGNGRDVWVLTTTGNTDTIQIFLLTATGFNMVPITYVSGIKHGVSYQGYLKPSPDESKLAIAYFNGGFDLYDFDRCTGMPSNPIALKSNSYWSAYGVEFSPDGTKLYGVDDEGYDIYQFNLSVGWDSASIAGSMQVVGMSSDIDLGGLQLGPDGKIYLARIYTPYLGVINDPNVLGTGCNFVDTGLYLQYGSSNIGLPNIFIPRASADTTGASAVTFIASDTSFCMGSPVNFTSPSAGTSYQWSFPGASPDTSTSQNPANIYYVSAGNYNVSLVVTSCSTDTLVKGNYIHVYSPGTAGSVTALPNPVCSGSTTELSVTGDSGVIRWQYALNGTNYLDVSGADSDVYTTAPLVQNTSYRAINGSGTCADTSAPVTVLVNTPPTSPVPSANDTLICANDSARVMVPGSFSHYLWNNGATANYTFVNAAGGYWVTVTDANGCTAISQHINIDVYPVPSVSIVEQGDTLASFGAVAYQWYLNDTAIMGATLPMYIATQSGNYAVQVTDTNGCRELSNYTYVTVTGINDLTQGITWSVYPNPANETVHIIISQSGYYSLLNAIGQEIRTIHLNASDNVVPVSNLPDGIYLIVNGNNFSGGKKLVIDR